jgi:MFS family permease
VATVDDRNARYLCEEIFWASILGCMAGFNAAFAVRLGARSGEIGLLSSAPALLAVLLSIPSGRFLERRAGRKWWILGSLMLHRAGYALVALVPFMPQHLNRGALLVAVLVALSAPGHFFGVGWNAMLADLVPERRRAAVFATRNIINVGTVSIGSFLAGQWLSHIDFPFNYQIAYAVGFLASGLSSYRLFQLEVPDSLVAPRTPRTARSLKADWGSFRETVLAQGAFVRMTVDTLLYSLGAWAAAPLYTLYFVRELGASDAWIGLLATIANVSAIVGYGLARRTMGRWGENNTLKRMALGTAIYPILVGLSSSLLPIPFGAGLEGLISPGVNLSHFSLFLRACPDDRRPTFVGVYTTIMNVGAFGAPLIAVAVAGRLGVGVTVVGCGLLRLLGAMAFWLWPVDVGR